jgi:hypothetical protein
LKENVYVIKDEFGHFEEKCAKIIQSSWQEGQIRLRIRPGKKVPDPTGFESAKTCESNEIWTSAMAETKYTERPVINSLKPKSEDLPNFWQENTAFM